MEMQHRSMATQRRNVVFGASPEQFSLSRVHLQTICCHPMANVMNTMSEACNSGCRVGRAGRQKRQSVNTRKVEELICSQKDAPGTHKSPQEIEQIKRIARSSVVMLTDIFAYHIAESLY